MKIADTSFNTQSKIHFPMKTGEKFESEMDVLLAIQKSLPGNKQCLSFIR